MFGNLDDFSFDLQDLVSHYLWETDEKRGKDSVDARQGSPASHQPATASIDAVHDLNSHCLASESETVKSHESVDINKEEAVDSTNNDAPRNSEISEIDRAASPLDSRIPSSIRRRIGQKCEMEKSPCDVGCLWTPGLRCLCGLQSDAKERNWKTIRLAFKYRFLRCTHFENSFKPLIQNITR